MNILEILMRKGLVMNLKEIMPFLEELKKNGGFLENKEIVFLSKIFRKFLAQLEYFKEEHLYDKKDVKILNFYFGFLKNEKEKFIFEDEEEELFKDITKRFKDVKKFI